MKPKILYVDDETQNLITFKSTFREVFDITICSSGHECLKILNESKKNEFEVIISDQRMPQMSGDILFSNIPENHQNATRILLTAYTSIEDAKKALNSGKISFFFNKPFQHDEFLKAIKEGVQLFRKKIEFQEQKQEIRKITDDQIKRLITDSELIKRDISENLHENIAQQIAITKMYISTINKQLIGNESGANQILKESSHILNNVVNQIRSICVNLSPRNIKLFGIEDPMGELCHELEQKYDIPINLTFKSPLPRFTEEVELNSWRIFNDFIILLIQNNTTEINLTVQHQNKFLTFFITSLNTNKEIQKSTTLHDIISKIKFFNGEFKMEEVSIEKTFSTEIRLITKA